MSRRPRSGPLSNEVVFSSEHRTLARVEILGDFALPNGDITRLLYGSVSGSSRGELLLFVAPFLDTGVRPRLSEHDIDFVCGCGFIRSVHLYDLSGQ